MAKVYISVGSNIDRERNIRAGVTALQRHYGTLHRSPVYESPALGFDGAPFYNLVLKLETTEDPHTVAERLRAIEDVHGRVRSSPRFSSRTLDLDLLLYDDLVLKDEQLELPRAEILHHAHVLRPLTDLAPHLHHPVNGKTYLQLWEDFHQSEQPLWPVHFDW